MGVLVGRAACPACRKVERVERAKEQSYFSQLPERYLENFRAFLEAADLYLVSGEDKRYNCPGK